MLAGKLVRNKKMLFLTDSGAPIYRKRDSKGKNRCATPQSYLTNQNTNTHPWTNLITCCEYGAGWVAWTRSLQEFIETSGHDGDVPGRQEALPVSRDRDRS